jgi:drug/metabolite transporter (DMT)-like permease
MVLLLIVTLGWGSTFPLLKSLSDDLDSIEISTIRFLLAAICVLPFLIGAPRRTWKDGAILGGMGLVSYVTQAYGLQHISSNRSAFLTSLNVLMVPFLGLMFGGRLSWPVLLAACVACAGVGLMSWESGGNLAGDAATILCAFSYAAYVVMLSQRSGRHEAGQLAATQIAVMAAVGALWLLFQSMHSAALATLAARAAPHFPALLYLGAGATAGTLFLQAVAQRNVAADKAAVVYAMEPVFAALFAWLWLNELLGWRGAVGGALIVAAIVVSETRPASRKSTLTQ